MTKNEWLNRINNIDCEDAMENLFNEIANDDTLTNDEYSELYEIALNKVR